MALWLLGWATLICTACILLPSVAFYFAPSLRPAWWPGGTTAALPIGFSLVLGIGQAFLLGYVGDAAVYLSASPRNVAARNDIRAAGVALIERLHTSGNYDRIMVVGHSLGSVIGYDVLSYAFQRHNERHGSPRDPGGEEMEAAERAAAALGGSGSASEADLCQWRQATTDLWLEQRRNGFPWLVTDFVTLGSPLAHGDILLASNRSDFCRRIKDRELPTCPPVTEKGGRFSYPDNYKTAAGERRTLRILHYAALFAVTRWTNLYFLSSWLLKGDLVGGPVAAVFGQGVRDIAVQTAAWKGWLAHTRYWSRDLRDAGKPGSPTECLHRAIDIEGRGLREAEKRRAPAASGPAAAYAPASGDSIC
jgi:hypothetical protein